MHLLRLSASWLLPVAYIVSVTVLHGFPCAGALSFGTQPNKVTYEAEQNTKRDRVSFKKSEIGYSGRGYIDYDKNGYIEWNNVTAFAGEGEYIITVRYAAQDPAGRACSFLVNNEEKAVLPFISTGSYRNWADTQLVVQLKDGLNIIRIRARNRGPHIDKMDVSIMTPSPTPSPTSSPSKSAQPTMTAAPVSPTGSPTIAPTATPTSATAVRSFQMKLFFEEGMTWQETYERRSWCAECVNCGDEGGITEIRRCDKKEKQQQWFYRNNRVVSAKNPSLCMGITRIENSRVRMEKCDSTKDQQVWNGLIGFKKFQLRPKLYPSRCLTQEHHPRSNEHLLLIDCFEAERNDGSLTYPLDGTSYWEIGTWHGHEDEGLLFRHGHHQ